MAIQDYFNVKRSSNDPEDMLWAYDPDEHDNPKLHAKRNEPRFSVLLRLVRSLEAEVRQTKMLLFIIIVMLVVNASPELAEIIRSLVGG